MIFNQQQYMGASIRSFNASLGWGGSTSNLDVNLVNDTTRLAADNFFLGERFNPVEVGLPSIFKFSGFNDDDLNLPGGTGQFVQWSFGGIVKSFRQDNSVGGSPLFSVSVSDPREILGGTQLILDDYFGSVSGIPNVLNVFGAVEDILQLNSNAPNYIGNFGGMQRNDTGTPWYIIKDAVHYMTSGNISQHYGTFLKQKNYKYTFNFSDFPANLPSGYRVAPTDSMSLLDYVSDVCQAASHDFFVTLEQLYYPNGNLILDENFKPIHEIRVNTVSRAYLPEPSSIARFIANTDGATVKNLGFEFRNATNAKFLLGGNINTMYMSYGSGYLDNNGNQIQYSSRGIDYISDPIHQYLGTNINGNILQEIRPDDPLIGSIDVQIGKFKKAENIILIDTRDVDDNIYNEAIYLTTLDELRAIQNSKEDWENYLQSVSKYKYIPINKDDESWLTSHGVSVQNDCVELFVGLYPQKIKSFDPTLRLETENTYLYGTKFIVGYGWPASILCNQDAYTDLVYKENGAILTQFLSKYANKFPPSNSASTTLPLLTDSQPLITSVHTVNELIRVAQNEDGTEVVPNPLRKAYVYQKYVLYPVDRYGYTPMIAGSYGPIYPDTIIATWSKDYKIVEYKHSNVINVHYRKYGFLGLTCASNDSEFLETVSNIAIGNDKRCSRQMNITKSNIVIDEVKDAKITAFYNFLKKFAENYGKKYMVNMPLMLTTHDLTTSGIITSFSTSDAGYFTTGELKSAVDNQYLPVNYFNLTQEDNRIIPYAIYPHAALFNFESFNNDDITYSYYPNGIRDKAYIKCSVDSDFAYVDRYSRTGIYPKAIVSLPGSVHYKEEFDNAYKGNVSMEHLANLANVSSGNYIGIDSTFEYDAPRAIPPMFIAVPLQNNTVSYGPWWNIGATGQIEYERDESLVPWNYGGFSGLDTVARTKISEVAIQQQDENGSIEFPGMPTVSLGRQLEWISNGSSFFGPYVTDISVDFGEAGIKTNYKMQTWTPKFGKLAKQYEDDVRKSSVKSQQASRIARERSVTGFDSKMNFGDGVKKTMFKTVTFKDKRDNVSKRNKNNSSHHILAAQNIGIPSSGNPNIQSIVVIQPTYNTKSQIFTNYNEKAITSLDSVFRPYSTYVSHSGNLPHFENINTAYKNWASNNLIISSDMQPFEFGNDINLISTDEEFPKDGLGNNGQNYSTSNNYRGVGFKNPVIIVGHGRNINGKPVPNFNSYKYDTYGNYVYNSSGNENSDRFANNYLNRSDMWKAGPLDTRWDDRKKMWVAGSTLVEGYLVEDLAASEGRFSTVPFTSGLMVLCGGTYANVESGYQPKVWDRADASGYYSSGLLATGQSGLLWRSSGDYYSSLGGPVASGGNPNLFVLLINRSTQLSAASGTYVIASPMPNGDYRPIWVDCEPGERVGIE